MTAFDDFFILLMIMVIKTCSVIFFLPHRAVFSYCFAFSFRYNVSSLCVEQDGIVSPETDSGFNGTESRHPTPTEVPKLLPQGAMERWDCLLCLVKMTSLYNPQAFTIAAKSI